jgi:hypothetical protein
MNREDHTSLLLALTVQTPGADELIEIRRLLQSQAREMHVDDLYKALDESERLLKSRKNDRSLPEEVFEHLHAINYSALREIQDRMRAT